MRPFFKRAARGKTGRGSLGGTHWARRVGFISGFGARGVPHEAREVGLFWAAAAQRFARNRPRVWHTGPPMGNAMASRWFQDLNQPSQSRGGLGGRPGWLGSCFRGQAVGVPTCLWGGSGLKTQILPQWPPNGNSDIATDSGDENRPPKRNSGPTVVMQHWLKLWRGLLEGPAPWCALPCFWSMSPQGTSRVFTGAIRGL